MFCEEILQKNTPQTNLYNTNKNQPLERKLHVH